MLDVPYKILLGPIYNNHAMIGDFIHSPNIKVFMNEPTSLEGKYADYNYSLTSDTFDDILAQLPPNWEPDLVLWWDVVFRGVPPGIEECPYPTAAVIGDWNLGFTTVLQYAQAFDFILADRALINLLSEKGYQNCHYWANYSYDPTQHYLIPDLERIYDVTFIGNLNFRLHGKRSHYLRRLAQLSPQYHVFIAHGLFGKDYRQILNQSKIVLNHSIRGEMNMRAYEAPACGALLFMEEENLETSSILSDRQSCVFYNQDNFEQLLQYYLKHENERQKIALLGHQTILKNSHQFHFKQLLTLIPTILEKTVNRQRTIKLISPENKRLTIARQLYHAQSLNSPASAIAYLNQWFQTNPLSKISARALNAMATFIFDSQFQCLQEGQSYPENPSLLQALQLFQTALTKHPDDLILNYHQSLCLDLLGKKSEAKSLYIDCLEQLNDLSLDSLKPFEDFVLPYGYHHHFYIEWQRNRFQARSDEEYLQNCKNLLGWQIAKQLMMCCSLEGLLQEALHYACKAYQYKSFGESAYLLGHLYRCLNQKSKALQYFTEALDKDTLLLDLWQEYSQLLLEGKKFNHLLTFCQSTLTILKHNQQALELYSLLKQLSTIARVELSTGELSGELLILLKDPDLYKILNDNKSSLLHPLLKRLAEPIDFCWHSLIEPMPMEEGFNQVLDPQSAGVNIADQPFDYAYYRSFHLLEDAIDPLKIPFQFPSNLSLSPVVEVEFDLNFLILCPSFSADWLLTLLESFAEAELKDCHCFVYAIHPPDDNELETFVSLLSDDALQSNLTILNEPLSHSDLASIISCVDILIAQPISYSTYFLWWSLFLGTPIWTLKPLPLVYKDFSVEDVRIFYELDFSKVSNNMTVLQSHADEIQRRLSLFYQSEASTVSLQTLWGLKIDYIQLFLSQSH